MHGSCFMSGVSSCIVLLLFIMLVSCCCLEVDARTLFAFVCFFTHARRETHVNSESCGWQRTGRRMCPRSRASPSISPYLDKQQPIKNFLAHSPFVLGEETAALQAFAFSWSVRPPFLPVVDTDGEGTPAQLPLRNIRFPFQKTNAPTLYTQAACFVIYPFLHRSLLQLPIF